MTDKSRPGHDTYHAKYTWPKRIAIALIGVPGMILAGIYAIERIRNDASEVQALEAAIWSGGIAFVGGLIGMVAGVLPSERLQRLVMYFGGAVVGISVFIGPALA